MRLALAASLWAATATGCAHSRTLRLETAQLRAEVATLQAELAAAKAAAPPDDYVANVDLASLGAYLSRAGYPGLTPGPGPLYTLGIHGANTDFQVSVQLFEREKVVYFVVHDYLTIEEASSSQAMVLLLSQLAVLNFDLLLGKFQLNPRTGDISLSVEVQVDDGLGFRTFDAVLRHITQTADKRYPELMRAARSNGI